MRSKGIAEGEPGVRPTRNARMTRRGSKEAATVSHVARRPE